MQSVGSGPTERNGLDLSTSGAEKHGAKCHNTQSKFAGLFVSTVTLTVREKLSVRGQVQVRVRTRNIGIDQLTVRYPADRPAA